jgi:hypothetical protein
MKQLEGRKLDDLIPNYEPPLGITINDNFIEFVAVLPRAPQNVYNVLTTCNWVGANGIFKWLFIGGWRKFCYTSGVDEVDIGEFGKDVLAANINDVCETHDPSVQVIKFNVALTKQASKFLRDSTAKKQRQMHIHLPWHLLDPEVVGQSPPYSCRRGCRKDDERQWGQPSTEDYRLQLPSQSNDQ